MAKQRKPPNPGQMDLFGPKAEPEKAPEQAPEQPTPPSRPEPRRVPPSPLGVNGGPAPRLAAPESLSPLALERNLALMAGAGAGKTFSLVTICLHLLGGARSNKTPLRPAQLCLLTFTDKAAAEMRERLRERLDELAGGRDGAGHGETQLRATFDVLGLPFPRPEFWRAARDELGAATVGTFHALCVQLLRTAPAGFDVDPSFELLDERDAGSLIHDVGERVVLDALERGDPEVVELCREMNFASGLWRAGLVGDLCALYGKLREEGLSPGEIEIGDEERARGELEAGIRNLRQVAAAAATLRGHSARPDVAARCARGLDGLTYDNFLDRLPELMDAVADQGLSRGADLLKQLKFGIRGKSDNDVTTLRDFYGQVRIVRFEAAVRKLLAELETRHRQELRKRSALDFSELLIQTRNLLRDHPAVRKEVQARIGALLVDEFQDTNRLQLEVVMLLGERREGAPRAVPPSTPLGVNGMEFPLEPAFLCAVGDRKQSIYEFRGADVAVFERLAKRIEAEGGIRSHLQANWRSSPELLGFFNRLFPTVLAPKESEDGERDYEVAYVSRDDDLEARRSTVSPGPCVDRLIYAPDEKNADMTRWLDADMVARHVRTLLAPATGFQVGGERDAPRALVGNDVAILFRRFTYLEVYRQALMRYGVPHRVVRGRGFYGAQEVLDLASFLTLLADPGDPLALPAVLRSPLVALSDGSLFRIAWGQKRPLRLRDLEDERWRTELPEREAARLTRFLSVFHRIRRERDRLGIRVVLEVAIEELGYRVALAASPFGEQALANVDKLLELAGRRDASGDSDGAGFAKELAALADADPTEAQADTLDASDPRAVQLMTIHQAKGLEWPVVVVPDLAVRPRFNNNARVLFDRAKGLALRPWIPDRVEWITSPRFEAIEHELQRREQAEYLRLLYVALTRARDRLVLSGRALWEKNTWRQMLDLAIDGDAREWVRDVNREELDEPPELAPPVAAPVDSLARVHAAVARVRQRPPARVESTVLPVTHLQNFSLCPRRYLYANQIGLTEHPLVFALEDEGANERDGRSPADPRLRGTVAHRLLERVELAHVARGGGALRKQLEELLWSEGLSAEDPHSIGILEDVQAFLGTRFARALAEAGAARVHRELPFLLRIPGRKGGPALHLKGQIDLLFEDEQGGATVIDYKFSRRHPQGLEPYSFQLDCYALAARQFVKEGVPVRTGIAFLREPGSEPEIRTHARAEDLNAFGARLVAETERLIALEHAAEWPGLEEPECKAIACGYRYRCHPDKRA